VRCGVTGGSIGSRYAKTRQKASADALRLGVQFGDHLRLEHGDALAGALVAHTARTARCIEVRL
jgi:hypothetical protein